MEGNSSAGARAPNGSRTRPHPVSGASNLQADLGALLKLPVAVNCVSGDPFQPSQLPNTIAKLRALKAARHQGPVALHTKVGVSAATIERIAADQLDLFLFYTVTGLRESREYTLEQALGSYGEACRILPSAHVALVIRPVIPGRNDDLALLEPMLDAAAEGQRMLIVRGFREADWSIRCDEAFMESLAAAAISRRLRLFRRTACVAAEMRRAPCRVHDEVADPAGVAAAIALGYAGLLHGHPATGGAGCPAPDRVRASLGDLHFIRLLSGLPARCDEPMPTNRLSLLTGPGGAVLDCSSSWFTYANSVPCAVGCFYCECNYRPAVRGEIGCVPGELLAASRARRK